MSQTDLLKYHNDFKMANGASVESLCDVLKAIHDDLLYSDKAESRYIELMSQFTAYLIFNNYKNDVHLKQFKEKMNSEILNETEEFTKDYNCMLMGDFEVIEFNGGKCVAKLSIEKFDDFRELCTNIGCYYEILSLDDCYALCRSDISVFALFAIFVIAELNYEIETLCWESKETLTKRSTGKFTKSQWVNEKKPIVAKVALRRYDQPFYSDFRKQLERAN